jgi:hypothetical protein
LGGTRKRSSRVSLEVGKDKEVLTTMKAVFDESGTSFAEEFTDKVRGLHEHFDLNKDGFLNFEELRSLQLMTSGEDMKPEHYEMACRALDCHPSKGLSLDALRLTYAADGTNIGT